MFHKIVPRSYFTKQSYKIILQDYLFKLSSPSLSKGLCKPNQKNFIVILAKLDQYLIIFCCCHKQNLDCYLWYRMNTWRDDLEPSENTYPLWYSVFLPVVFQKKASLLELIETVPEGKGNNGRRERVF